MLGQPLRNNRMKFFSYRFDHLLCTYCVALIRTDVGPLMEFWNRLERAAWSVGTGATMLPARANAEAYADTSRTYADSDARAAVVGAVAAAIVAPAFTITLAWHVIVAVAENPAESRFDGRRGCGSNGRSRRTPDAPVRSRCLAASRNSQRRVGAGRHQSPSERRVDLKSEGEISLTPARFRFGRQARLPRLCFLFTIGSNPPVPTKQIEPYTGSMHFTGMDRDWEKQAIEVKLATCNGWRANSTTVSLPRSFAIGRRRSKSCAR